MAADAKPDHADQLAVTAHQPTPRGAKSVEGVLASELVQQLKPTGPSVGVFRQFEAGCGAVVKVRGQGEVAELGEAFADVADVCADAEQFHSDQDGELRLGGGWAGEVAGHRRRAGDRDGHGLGQHARRRHRECRVVCATTKENQSPTQPFIGDTCSSWLRFAGDGCSSAAGP